ncbi:hypothetical protein ACFL27_14680 [candidate division CSSED10-310 bacterium]|uniref:Uncharacterized protein n=1 Tax=candidate division CSSED10-310 bacterium TaxID=2855610 RepID=A0ABV6YZ15_UNCC1
MADLTDKQKDFYQTTLEMTRQEIEDIDNEVERELAEVKERITMLNQEKESVRQVYEGACARLGIGSELAEEDASEE